MKDISKLCEKIVAHLTAMGSPIDELLHPGIQGKEMQNVAQSLPFVFPASVSEMYQWHNGTELVAGSVFFPWWTFDTVIESLERYRILSAADPNKKIWANNWFPFLSGSDISSIGIACGTSARKDAEIIWFEYTVGVQTGFLSLEIMLKTLIASYESGAFFMGIDGEIDCNTREFSKIARRFNPGVRLWDDYE